MLSKKELKLHPDNFEMECTTVWAFPRRGNWATHASDWRGNWSPEVVRNLILRYSKEKDHLLDCMIGGGTTAIEAKILNRHITCVDVNEDALERTKKSLEFDVDNKAKQRIIKCDAREMKFLKDDEIDLVAKELHRVLKTGKFCAVLMGDTRRNKMYQPLAFKVMNKFLECGFQLKEDIIKKQHNCSATGFWVNRSKESNFLLIMHEHLFIFQK